MKVLLSGNEAIAQGAYRAGVRIASGYPGTPSTEILENLAQYKEVEAEWAPNEKVALEVAFGASLAGARSLVSMKHVGLNVAADPLFTMAYTGVNAGVVIVTADDPGMHSSQNEQDNRHYARAAKIPMLEPSDSAEALLLTEKAFEISERFDVPVLLRVTTRISHSKSPVEVDLERAEVDLGYVKDVKKYVMIPSNARERHKDLQNRLTKLRTFSEEFNEEYLFKGSSEIGFITSGISYQYVREVFPEASVLKLTMTYPLPRSLLIKFAKQVKRVIVVEELDPYLEEQIKALGLPVEGKNLLPEVGELSPEILREAITGKKTTWQTLNRPLPKRPPMLCPGCPYRSIFFVAKRLKVPATGDIGCYTLGVLPPLEVMETCLCMGASISSAHGFQKASSQEGVLAFIGDSTFVHSGITPLINLVYNRSSVTVIILDNRTTAMTGRQDHPGTGRTLKGETVPELDFAKLAKSIGIKHVYTIDPYDLEEVTEVLTREVSRNESSVIISKRACLLVERPSGLSYTVTEECNSCKLCLRLGCPALVWDDEKVKIDSVFCTGCSLCAQICPFGAVEKVTKADD
jgi:indolepyruvate ferredoxin oxidoreductase alpha subunit